MNPAITAALLAASKESENRDPVERLTKAGAINAQTATELDIADPSEQKEIDSAVANGLITRHYSGKLYVNEGAVADYNQRIGYGFLLALFIAASAGASIVALIAFNG